MSGRPVEPDPIVETMLQLLPIPEHGDDFWVEMEARLAAEPAGPLDPAARGRTLLPAAPIEPLRPITAEVPVVELVRADHQAVVPPALRRRSNAVLCAIAAAAAVVVAVAGATLVRDRRADDTELAAGGTTTTLASASTEASPLAAAAGDPAAEAVLAWVQALAAGQTSVAWDALGPASQDHWGAESAFAQEQTGLAEGYGAWAGTVPDLVLVTPLDAAGADDVVIVTLVGTVEQEGERQRRADAFAVRLGGDAPVLEPWGSEVGSEVVVPELLDDSGARGSVERGAALVVVVPADAAAPTLRLDDGTTVVCGEAPGTELTDLEQAPGQRCEWHPEGGIPAGSRVLTVGYVTPDGAEISARSVLFDAA